MSTLFGKVLLWFLGALLLTIAAVVVTTALTLNLSETRQPPFGGALRLQMREAVTAWETGGANALAASLHRFHSVFPGEHVLTDATGHDLLTGKDYSDLITESRKRPILPFIRPRVMARPTAGDQYWFLTILTRRESLFWFIQSWHLWVVGLIMLLSYALARHLANPIQRLRLAVDRFGRGDLSARVEVRGKDEMGQLGQTFNQMADRLESLLIAQRRLLQDISHELRSPLARLNVAIELARTAPDPEPTLDRIQKEADRLNTLVGELIEVTRAEGDPAQRRSEPVRLDAVVKQVVEDGEIEAKALGCRLDYADSERLMVLGDAELLRRAVENVIRNAIRHAPEGSAVEISAAEQRDGVHVTVRDRGPGVPDDVLSNLFEPFYRVESDRDRSSGGVGLGLAIVKRAVELHHGTVTAMNANPGLLVEIVIPSAPKPAAHDAEPVAVARL